jgi:hypothetical protein
MVRRFRPYYFDPTKLLGHEATMRQNTEGDYVLHEDFAKVEAALRMLMRAYVNTLEGGRDRIVSLGGSCDDVPTMEAGDPALRHAKSVLATADGEVK